MSNTKNMINPSQKTITDNEDTILTLAIRIEYQVKVGIQKT
jgi:hypothetical protein